MEINKKKTNVFQIQISNYFHQSTAFNATKCGGIISASFSLPLICIMFRLTMWWDSNWFISIDTDAFTIGTNTCIYT